MTILIYYLDQGQKHFRIRRSVVVERGEVFKIVKIGNENRDFSRKPRNGLFCFQEGHCCSYIHGRRVVTLNEMATNSKIINGTEID